MKTIFLAAGHSSRMQPIEDKNFLEFCGEPLIVKLLKNAQAAGCDDFIIVSNQSNYNQITTLCQKVEFLNHSQVIIQQDLSTGMAGGILAALKKVGPEENIIILNGNDLVTPQAITEVIKTGTQNDGAILGQIRESYFPGGYLQVDGEKKITSIIEKPGAGNEPSNLVNIVVHYFKKAGDLKQILSTVTSDQDDTYEVALDQCFKTQNLKAVMYDGPWQAIKYPWHVLEMMNIFLSSQETYISEEAQISQSATIKGDRVVIEAGVKVFENAVICGPCYIGKNTIIGNGALVRHAHIGANTSVGYNTEIARSWLNHDVTTHIAYIGDSIIESGVNFGAFSCTANLRLDKKDVRVKIKENLINSHHQKLGAIVGKNVQIGVGVKLMPGSKVDKNTLIKPNTIWS